MSKDVLRATGISSGGTDVAGTRKLPARQARARVVQHGQQKLNFSVFLRRPFAGHLL